MKEEEAKPTPRKPLKLLESLVHFDVEELARQMTYIDAKLFKAIRVTFSFSFFFFFFFSFLSFLVKYEAHMDPFFLKLEFFFS